jgi:hypothetical protein
VDVGEIFDGVTLVGVGLIAGGIALLVSGLVGAWRGLGRHRRQRRAARWRGLDMADPPVPEQAEIRRSALLADTVVLYEVMPIRGTPRPPAPARPYPNQRPDLALNQRNAARHNLAEGRRKAQPQR